LALADHQNEFIVIWSAKANPTGFVKLCFERENVLKKEKRIKIIYYNCDEEFSVYKEPKGGSL